MVEYKRLHTGPDFSNLTLIGNDQIEQLRETVFELIGRPSVPQPPSHPSLAKWNVQLSDYQRERYCRYFGRAYDDDLATLANMPPNSGRNRRTFRFVCRFGRLVHHQLVLREKLISDVVAACIANGLIAEDGMPSVQATIRSGLRASASDALPDLGACDDR